MNGQNSADVPVWAWVAFGGAVAVLLTINLFLSRGKKEETRAYAIGWSIVWISAAVIFGGFVWFMFGANRGHEYFAAWLMEESLSMDNLFVFYMIFQSLGIEDEHAQHKVLFWGILGAVVFRGAFIFLGVAALEQWKSVSFVFGALLLYAAWKAFRNDPTKHGRSPVLRWLSRRLPIMENAPNGQFIAKKDGSWAVTPLLLALFAIEISDIMFAIDSVPAALSITHERFIVYSSNIFAILGLRALYLLMAQTIPQLRYLHYGLAAVLGFAAFKMMADQWVHIPPLVSVGAIIAALSLAILASLHARRRTSPCS